MTRTWCGLLLTISAAAGCVSMPGNSAPGVKPASVPAARTPPGEVKKDQITEANAHERAQALRDELDRDAAGNSSPPADSSPKATEAGK